MGGGLPHGPVRAEDLVGIDVGFDVSSAASGSCPSGSRAGGPSHASPRGWSPPGATAARPGAATTTIPPSPTAPGDPEPPARRRGRRDGRRGGRRRPRRRAAGRRRGGGLGGRLPVEAEGELPWLIVDCARRAPRSRRSRAARAPCSAPRAPSPPSTRPGRPPGSTRCRRFDGSRLVELTRSATTSEAAARRTERFFASLGKHVEWVGDAPGLVLGRIVCQLVNEAAFALREGVGSAEDVDAGMTLGLNHPRGPLRWARRDRPRPRAGASSTPSPTSTTRRATAPLRCCAAACSRGGWAARRAPASSSTTTSARAA